MKLTEEQRKKLVELIMKITNTSEENAERIERIIEKYPPKKILVALNSMVQYTRRYKKKPIPLEKLEETIKRVRF